MKGLLSLSCPYFWGSLLSCFSVKAIEERRLDCCRETKLTAALIILSCAFQFNTFRYHILGECLNRTRFSDTEWLARAPKRFVCNYQFQLGRVDENLGLCALLLVHFQPGAVPLWKCPALEAPADICLTETPTSHPELTNFLS